MCAHPFVDICRTSRTEVTSYLFVKKRANSAKKRDVLKSPPD